MVERLLAPHEAAVAEAGVRVVLHSEVEGDLDEEILAEALARLRFCYPLLAGGIIRRAEGEQVVRIDETAPGPLLNNGVDLDQEINTPLPGTRARCCDSRCCVSLTAPA
ncbi:hypothetical protein OG413_29435 [Streptomyces sp. NBC_01433]|uniref:hypothetical protein n=1 Tax=Streptomyces sp. NBC_01433 TaxID=2903864 RepID=UPI00225ACBD5|nr:hypothetical protein [Streptomyces sp. NBC_01433]MCX4679364.1 hypothetical protein [Streptomyces sp. NBC_01433]